MYQYLVGGVIFAVAYLASMWMLRKSEKRESALLVPDQDRRDRLRAIFGSMFWALTAWIPASIGVWIWHFFGASALAARPWWLWPLFVFLMILPFAMAFVPRVVPTKAAQFFGLSMVLAVFAQPWFHRGESHGILWWHTTYPSGAVVAMLLVVAGAIVALRGGRLPAWLALGVVIWLSTDWGTSNWADVLYGLAVVLVLAALVGLVLYHTRELFQSMAATVTLLLLVAMQIALIVVGFHQQMQDVDQPYWWLQSLAEWLLALGLIMLFVALRVLRTWAVLLCVALLVLSLMFWTAHWIATSFDDANLSVTTSTGQADESSDSTDGTDDTATDESTDTASGDDTGTDDTNGEEADQAKDKDKNKPSAKTIRALTVSFVDSDNTCSILVRKHGGRVATTDDGEDIVKFDIGALHRVGTGKDLRRWSDALSTPLSGETNADKLEAVKVAICQDPLYGATVANMFATLRVGDVKVRSLNPWLKGIEAPAKINDSALKAMPLAGVNVPTDAQVAKAVRRNQAWQDTAARLNTLLDRFQVTKVRSLTSVRNWHLVAGGLVAGSLPEVGLNPQQESLPALVLEITQKGACAPLAVIGFNAGDKRPEVFPTPSCGSTPTPGTPTTTPPGNPPSGGCVPPKAPNGYHVEGCHLVKDDGQSFNCQQNGGPKCPPNGGAQGGGGHGQAGGTSGAPDQPSSSSSGSGGAPPPTNPPDDTGQGGSNDTPILTPGG
ncbi:DMT family transporter [Candidatus Saccharibacteria bacterium]|nr:DMT family transporter [Candidatus Saccharibacteria bacterium]